MPKVSFPEYLGQELLDAIHFPACSLGASAAPQTFHSLQLATDTELAHHYIQYASSTLCFLCLFAFFLSVEKISSKYFIGPLATSKRHALLVYSSCHHGKM